NPAWPARRRDARALHAAARGGGRCWWWPARARCGVATSVVPRAFSRSQSAPRSSSASSAGPSPPRRPAIVPGLICSRIRGPWSPRSELPQLLAALEDRRQIVGDEEVVAHQRERGAGEAAEVLVARVIASEHVLLRPCEVRADEAGA